MGFTTSLGIKTACTFLRQVSGEGYPSARVLRVRLRPVLSVDPPVSNLHPLLGSRPGELPARWCCCAVRCGAVQCAAAPRASLKNLPPRDTAHPRKHQSPSACHGTAVVKRKWLRHIWFWLGASVYALDKQGRKELVSVVKAVFTESDSQGYNNVCVRVEVHNRTTQ